MKRILALCCLLTSSLFAIDPDLPTLTLSAKGTIYKPADELQMKVGVITSHDTAEVALDENSHKMQAIIQHLTWLGLEKDDYETSQFAITPLYTPYPKNPPPDWKRTLIGYEVTNSILVHTPKLNLIGRLIDCANTAGANSITDLRFGLRSSRQYWTEALTAAASNAVSDAQAIASATGVELVRVLSITLNQTHVHGPQLSATCMAMEARMDNAPPIEPGDVALEASVTLIYEIK